MTDLSWLEDYGDPTYNGFDMTTLERDGAFLSIKIGNDFPNSSLHLYKKHADCIECPFAPKKLYLTNETFQLSEVPNILYRVSNKTVGILYEKDDYICEFGSNFGEFGIYETEINSTNCQINTIKNAVSISFPVLTVFLIYCAIFLGLFCVAYIVKRFFQKVDRNDGEATTKGKTRIRSLDTFRGISIVIMIFVNYGGGGYFVLEHAVWNGLHFADLVFPWFMWIMGVCIPISLASSFRKKLSNKEIFFNVLKRSIKLFCLGIFLGGGTSLQCLRIFGVLQRFGISYLVATTICLLLMNRNLTISEHKIGKFFTDLLVLLKGWIIILIILFIYCMILFLVADEGCPKGYLGPGGYHKNLQFFNCTGGATGFIDRSILGTHVYPYPTSKAVYLGTQWFDPEGIFGCLPSILHVFIGVQAGTVLLVYQSHKDRLVRWIGWGAVTGLIGGGLCGFSQEDGVIPINKNLWSISFVMVTCCFAFFLLSVCYIFIDIKRWWSGKPFLYAGMNAILLYVGHSMTNSNFPVRWIAYCGKGHGTHLIALFENLWGAFFWVAVSFYWYKIKYFYVL